MRALTEKFREGGGEKYVAKHRKRGKLLARERITSVEFDHGDTRNLLAARSRGDLLVFLTQDAIPSDPSFLTKLVKNFEDSGVAAVTCRNVPRPDAQLLTKLFSENDPGYSAGRREVRLSDVAGYEEMSAHERRLLYNFNDVAAGYRREVWQLHPSPRTPCLRTLPRGPFPAHSSPRILFFFYNCENT